MQHAHRHRSVPVQVTAVRADRWLRKPDNLVTEEPLEIRVAGPGAESQPVGVTMRTPGNDFELAAGFLITEGVLSGQESIRSISYCAAADDAGEESLGYNTVTVESGHPVDLDERRRLFAISSACGVCGSSTLDDVYRRVTPIARPATWPLGLLVSLPAELRKSQAVFSETGGLHGAGLFDRSGLEVAVREDVGRHNAVDKVIGWAALHRRLPLDDLALAVSGRLGFEIVQKAAVAGVSHVVAVSAPSSLAIDLAQRLGMTVVAFVRGDHANIYCGEEGVELPPGT